MRDLKLFTLIGGSFTLGQALADRPLISNVSLTYNAWYDNSSHPVNQLACWDKETGSVGDTDWETLHNIPTAVIAIDTITDAKSDGCFSCYFLVYGDNRHAFIAIDGSGKPGFVVSKTSMDFLTNGKAAELNEIQVVAQKSPLGDCGFFEHPHEDL